MNITIIGIIVSMHMVVASVPMASAIDIQTPTSAASLIGIKISAKVYELSDQFNLLGGAIQIDDVITGKYVYDVATPDADNDSSIGTYRQTSASCYIQINSGWFVFKSDTNHLDYCLTIINDMFLPAYDIYEVRSNINQPLNDVTIVNRIDWTIADYNATALQSDSLPATAPVIEDWESFNVLLIMGLDPGNPDRTFEIKAYVTEATKNIRISLPERKHDATESSTIIHPFSTSLLMRWVDVFFERFPHTFPRLRMVLGHETPLFFHT
jgi:hypothetical protein